MKKQFLNLGKALNKAEQKEINGGKFPPMCIKDSDCLPEYGPISFCIQNVCT